MADSAVHALTQKTSLAATDEIYLVQSPYGTGDDRRAVLSDLDAFISATASALTNKTRVSIAGGTVTSSTPVFDASQTWNSGATTFTGLKLNVTKTASASASLLIDLQVGGASQFSVREDGRIIGTSGQALIYNAGSTVWLGPSGTNVGIFPNELVIGSNQDTRLNRTAAATLQHGAADAAAPVAQTISFQSVVAGTTNTAGVNATFKASAGTGTGAGGSFIFQVAPAGSSGTAQNAYQTALTIASDRSTTFGGQAILTGNPVLAQTSGGTIHGMFFTSTSPPVMNLSSTAVFGWGAGSPNSAVDTILARDAANTLALRNSTNAQTFNLYNTYTDASNNEALRFTWSSNTAFIQTVQAGTGTSRDLHIQAGSSTVMFRNSNVYYFSDNAYDFGASGANRPRTGYFGTRLQAPVVRADNSYTVATLPTGVVGNIARVTDASAPAVGSTVTGGGAAAALVWYNGSNYTVIGV